MRVEWKRTTELSAAEEQRLAAFFEECGFTVTRSRSRGRPRKLAHQHKWTDLQLAWLWRDVRTVMERDGCKDVEAIRKVQRNWRWKVATWHGTPQHLSPARLLRLFHDAKKSSLVRKAGGVIERLDDV